MACRWRRSQMIVWLLRWLIFIWFLNVVMFERKLRTDWKFKNFAAIECAACANSINGMATGQFVYILITYPCQEIIYLWQWKWVGKPMHMICMTLTAIIASEDSRLGFSSAKCGIRWRCRLNGIFIWNTQSKWFRQSIPSLIFHPYL